MKELIKTKNFALIFSHKGPDGDSVGSSVALSLYLSKIGVENKIIFPDPYPHFLSWITGINNSIVASENLEKVEQLYNTSDLIFCLDFNHRSRVGKDLQELISRNNNKYIFVIDHHSHPENFGNYEIIDQNASSTAELIYKFIDSNNDLSLVDIPISEAIYTGIITDTGSFKYSSVSSTTHQIAAFLKDKGLNQVVIHDKIFDQNSVSKINLLGYALQKIKIEESVSLAFLFLTEKELNMFNYQKGDSEGFVNYCLSIKGIENAVFLREDKDIIKISMRSKGKVKVNEFSSKFYAGGGHQNAAGAAVKNQDINTVVKELIQNFKVFCSE
ncbi:MAG: DHH family phosphoesterase [Crocinitomicaceae bacterium]|nr:DHH family phosphoesterase [Crocinitomicaceae bacterium]|tara:strand:- start:1372 stop:2358 length:987 start_codon:yes stop_codon:yes gene_type:complete